MMQQDKQSRWQIAGWALVILSTLALAGCAARPPAVAQITAAPDGLNRQTPAIPATVAPTLTPEPTDGLNRPSTIPPTTTATNTDGLNRPPTATPSIPPTASATDGLNRPPTATASATDGSNRPPTATATRSVTPDGAPRTARVPILMYHYISEPPADADIYRKDLSVSPARFESHLSLLKERGYHVVTLDDLLGFLANGTPLPEKPVILTFDDGYTDNYTYAYPLLRKYDMVGHFFIISDFVNQARPGYMTWPQIEEMASGGQRIGSHSRDHPDLKGKAVDYLVWQALGGLEAIREHTGSHPRWISYPAGSYDDQVIAVYKSAHYWGGLSTEQGATHTLDRLFALKRVRVRGTHTADDLAVLLRLDW
jgi:peptidoglycan/xylan/chitin deacetylase (PgdA/CDA1 family)